MQFWAYCGESQWLLQSLLDTNLMNVMVTSRVNCRNPYWSCNENWKNHTCIWWVIDDPLWVLILSKGEVSSTMSLVGLLKWKSFGFHFGWKSIGLYWTLCPQCGNHLDYNPNGLLRCHIKLHHVLLNFSRKVVLLPIRLEKEVNASFFGSKGLRYF